MLLSNATMLAWQFSKSSLVLTSFLYFLMVSKNRNSSRASGRFGKKCSCYRTETFFVSFALTEPTRKNEHCTTRWPTDKQQQQQASESACPNQTLEYDKYGVRSNHSKCCSSNSTDNGWLQVKCPGSGQRFTENWRTNLQLRERFYC